MQNTRVLRLGGSESLACNARHKGFMALSFGSLSMKTKHKGSKVLNFSIKRMSKTSSKQAQRQLGGSMKQAGSMLEASCRNRNANSRKLAGSLNKPEGNIKQA